MDNYTTNPKLLGGLKSIDEGIWNSIFFGERVGILKGASIKHLEIHERSIVFKNTYVHRLGKPKYIRFIKKHHKKCCKVLDFIYTPEVNILYVDTDLSDLKFKKCTVLAESPTYYGSYDSPTEHMFTGGLYPQMETLNTKV